MSGWGSGSWGFSPWGFGTGPLQLLRAFAVRENVVRLFFDQPVYFTQVLDPGDGSNPRSYSVVAVPGIAGDGDPTRTVNIIRAEIVKEAGAGGQQVDLVVDRAFSPFFCRYIVAVGDVRAGSGSLLDAAFTSYVFDGVQAGRLPMVPDQAIGMRDIANPQTLAALVGLPDATAATPLMLGTFRVDATGDVANDSGIISWKKRVIRRLITRPGGFAHMPAYGAGIPQQVKTLGRPGSRQLLAFSAEQQIRQEPETVSATVRIVQTGGQFRYVIDALTKLSNKPQRFEVVAGQGVGL